MALYFGLLIDNYEFPRIRSKYPDLSREKEFHKSTG
jgi:hypothetical protein